MATEGASGTIVQVVDGDVAVATWRVHRRVRPDLAFVDTLARLQLEARRHGMSIRLTDPSDELLALIDLVGLADVIGGLRLEVGREPERLEQLRVDEVMQPGDP